MNSQVSQYEFGSFLLDVVGHVLLRNGEPVALTPKAFDTLVVLVQNSGRILEKKELLDKVWAGAFIGEATLAQNIFTLRKALGRNPLGYQYIETIPKRGYRFIEQVRELQLVSADATANERDGGPPSFAPRPEAGQQDDSIDSLAILPFVNEGDDPETEYLSEGITESIINTLSLFPKLKVVARSIVFRYRDKDIHPQEAGRYLGVQAVLLGRVLQVGKRIIIKAELVDVAHGWQLWGGQYDRKIVNILALQEEIADRISETLRLKLPGRVRKSLSDDHTESNEAGQLYLHGRYHFNQNSAEGYLKAIEYFKQAVLIDPHYVLAYTGLADAYALRDFYGLDSSLVTFPKAKAAALKAVELEPQLAQSHTSLAYIKMLYEFDCTESDKEFHTALELNPTCVHTHYWQSRLLLSQGRFDDALSASGRALEIDEFNLNSNLHLGWCYFYTEQYGRAIQQMQQTLELEKSFWPARVMLGRALQESHKVAKALDEFQKAEQLVDSPVTLCYIAHAHARSGKGAKARRILDDLKSREGQSYVPPYLIAVLHAALNETDLAFEWLEKAYEGRNQWMGFLKVAPEFKNLRADARFDSLLKRLKLS
jgi:TolB-like protein